MSTATRPFDIFIVHAQTDAAFVRDVAQKLTDSGFNVLDDEWVEPGKPFGEGIRDAINDADAVVVLSTPASLTSDYVFIEIGAATAWDKPIFVIRSGVSVDDLPVSLRQYWNCPISDVDELTGMLASRLRKESIRLDDDEKAVLAKVYADYRLPLDELEYHQLEKIANRVSHQTGKEISPEVAMQVLLQMRKHSLLPKMRPRHDK